MRQWWRGPSGADGRGVQRQGGARVPGPGHRPPADDRLLDEIAARGYPLSALFPATMPLYRSLGWELAGDRDTVVIPARSLPAWSADARPQDGADAQTRTRGRRTAPGRAGRRGDGDRGARPGARSRPRLRPDHLGRGLGGGMAGRPGPVRVPRRGRLPRLPVAQRRTGTCSSSEPRRSRPAPSGRSGRCSARTPRSRSKVYARTGPASAFWWLTQERDADMRHRVPLDAAGGRRARRHRRPRVPRRDLAQRPAAHRRRRPPGQLRPLAAERGRGRGQRSTRLGPDAAAPPAPPSRWARAGWPRCTPGPSRHAAPGGAGRGGTPDDDAALDAAFAATPYMLDAF